FNVKKTYRHGSVIGFLDDPSMTVNTLFGKSSWNNLNLLFWEWGIWNLLYIYRKAQQFIYSFSQIYPLQDSGTAYTDVVSMFEAIGLSNELLLPKNGLDWLLQDVLGTWCVCMCLFFLKKKKGGRIRINPKKKKLFY
ncbi:hypothetical protein RFI_38630, partial [Reticulomyxa filosa]